MYVLCSLLVDNTTEILVSAKIYQNIWIHYKILSKRLQKNDETAEELTEKAKIIQDIKGEMCPYPQLEAKKALKNLKTNELLIQVTDHVPSTENVPKAVEDMEDAKTWKSGDGMYKIFLKKK